MTNWSIPRYCTDPKLSRTKFSERTGSGKPGDTPPLQGLRRRRYKSGRARIPNSAGTHFKQGNRSIMGSECIAKMANLSQYCTSLMGNAALQNDRY